jgi:hypothetical protein
MSKPSRTTSQQPKACRPGPCRRTSDLPDTVVGLITGHEVSFQRIILLQPHRYHNDEILVDDGHGPDAVPLELVAPGMVVRGWRELACEAAADRAGPRISKASKAHELDPSVLAALRSGWPEFGDAMNFIEADSTELRSLLPAVRPMPDSILLPPLETSHLVSP